MKNQNKSEHYDIEAMIAVIEDCIQKNKLELLANVICKLQTDYQELCELATDGEYQLTWTHRQVLDHITYQPKC